MKTEIYNLIILDESGSMSCVKKQTISGCNETINTIRAAQNKFDETQQHYVSIFAFQSGGSQPSRYIIKNMPVAQVEHVTANQYDPDGCTPLYDAVGSTLTDLKSQTKDNKLAIGSVTIITDGMENSSSHYSCSQVANMIEALKELGWSFNFIGANIDVKATAHSLNIDNSMEFEQNEEGTGKMFAKERRSRMGWLYRTHKAMSKYNSCSMSAIASEPGNIEDFRAEMREAASDYFADDRGEDVDKA